MRTRRLFILVVSILFLTVSACGPFTTGVVTVTPLPPTERPPAATLPTEVPSPTETASPEFEPISPEPTVLPPASEPQPPAPAHFRAGDAIQLDEIHMMSPTEGWGLSGPYVLITADGGLTWREVTPPDAALAGPQPKAYGAFLDRQTAWVVFATEDRISPLASVWHTADGGRTWMPSWPLQHEAYGDSVWAEFAALDVENVWLMVRGVYVGAGTHFAAQFFHTADGGLTWTPLPGDVGVDYTGLVFADASTGWLTWQTTGAYYNWPPEYAVTSDGGLNWESRELPPPPDAPGLFDQYPYCEPFQPRLFSSRSIRILMGCFDYHYPPQEFTSYLYTSEDSGTTWTTYRLPDKVSASQAMLIFFDTEEALLLGRDSYRSTDGGRTWTHVKTVSWDGQYSFVDPQHGWAVARANQEVALVKTINGGGTWTTINPTITK